MDKHFKVLSIMIAKLFIVIIYFPSHFNLNSFFLAFVLVNCRKFLLNEWNAIELRDFFHEYCYIFRENNCIVICRLKVWEAFVGYDTCASYPFNQKKWVSTIFMYGSWYVKLWQIVYRYSICSCMITKHWTSVCIYILTEERENLLDFSTLTYYVRTKWVKRECIL